MSDTIRVPRGTSAQFRFVWRQTPGGDPIPVTNYDAVLFDPHPALVGHLALAVGEGAAGEVLGEFVWDDEMPVGRIMYFNLRMVPKPAFPSLRPFAGLRIWIEVVE